MSKIGIRQESVVRIMGEVAALFILTAMLLGAIGICFVLGRWIRGML